MKSILDPRSIVRIFPILQPVAGCVLAAGSRQVSGIPDLVPFGDRPPALDPVVDQWRPLVFGDGHDVAPAADTLSEGFSGEPVDVKQAAQYPSLRAPPPGRM